MFAIVGLGNPGTAYEETRPNIGFRVVAELARRHGIRLEPWKLNSVGAQGQIEARKAVLLLPQTFMNLSGECVGPATRFFKLGPESVIVIHDELDLPLGRIQIKVGGGHAGHNGLRSLHQHLGSPEYVRVRCGIGRPPPQWDVARFVLAPFGPDERSAVDREIADAADAVERVFSDGLTAAMNAANRQMSPRPPAGS